MKVGNFPTSSKESNIDMKPKTYKSHHNILNHHLKMS